MRAREWMGTRSICQRGKKNRHLGIRRYSVSATAMKLIHTEIWLFEL